MVSCYVPNVQMHPWKNCKKIISEIHLQTNYTNEAYFVSFIVMIRLYCYVIYYSWKSMTTPFWSNEYDNIIFHLIILKTWCFGEPAVWFKLLIF